MKPALWSALLAVLGYSACATGRPASAPSSGDDAPIRTTLTEAVVDTGRIAGAPYRIEIPRGWKGGLIMYAHGYEVPGAPPASRRPEMPAMRDAFLSRGFALAQSDYRAQGWAVAEGIEDTEALRLHFIAKYGRSDSTFIIGHSMGGHITAATIERFPGHYHGALPLCGPLAPALDFFNETLFTLLVSFDHLFPGVLPAAAGGLADGGAPATVQPQAVAAALSAAPERATLLANRVGVRSSDLPAVISFYYIILKEVQRRAGGNPVDNTSTIYTGLGDDPAINRGVRRYAADADAVAYLRENYTPTGRTSDPVLSVHTTYDAVVPAHQVNRYAQTTALAGNPEHFVGRFVVADGHCNISPVQIGAAFDELRRWAAVGTRPAGGEVR